MENLKLCRLCALKKDNTLPIYGEEGRRLSLENKIKTCLNIQVNEQTNFPSGVCIECCQKLNSFNEFLEYTRNAQDTLKVIYSDNVKELEIVANELDTITPNDREGVSKNVHMENSFKQIENRNSFDDVYLESDHTEIASLTDEVSTSQTSLEKDSLDKRNDGVEGLNNEWDHQHWLCCDCAGEFQSVEELRQHHESEHKQEVKYMCPYCSKLFILYSAFITHLKRHQNSIKYNCLDCGKGFSNKKILDAHSLTHSDVRPYACQECGKSFRQQNALYIHSRCHLPEDIKNKYPCNLCNKRFSRKPNLVTHMRIHTGIRNFTCDQCGKSFMQKGNLDAHLLTHSLDKPFSCEMCNKRFKTEMQLRKHRSVHTGDKPHQCDVCGRTFREKGTLREHHRIHSGAMPFTCEFCGKTFRFKGILTTHRRQHTGERPYSCLECQHHFTNWPNYNKHMKRRHGINTSRTKANNECQAPPHTFQEIQANPNVFPSHQPMTPYMYNVYSLPQVPGDPLSL